MEEIARFLHAHPPFSELPLGVAQRAANVARIEYFAAGTVILEQGGAPAAFLYVVRRGSVELIRKVDGGEEVLDTLGEGELFGYVSLIRGRAPVVTVRAREETLVYLLPAALFHQLRRDEPAFAQLFARRVSDRLDLALQAGPHGAAPAPELFQTRLADLVRRPLVTIGAQATVCEAAGRMREYGVSALVVDVPEAGSYGIITDRDLRNRVLAVGLPDSTAVSAVMSAPALSLPAESLVFEALLTMLEHGIHHLPVTRGGEVAGMVTYTDILRRQSRSPLLLPSKLGRARDEADLRAYTDEVGTTVGALLDAGARVSDIGRVVAVAHDRLLVHLLRDAEEALGPPPRPYAWLVLGSEGRFEQTLRTDQDNALVYDDGPEDAEIEYYYVALAERVVARLVACGFPRCPGNIMATNPEWRRPLASWQASFAHWIGVPNEEALLQVAIFFDYRQVHGELDAEAALRPVIRRAPDQRVFLGRLARAALRQPAPLNFFRRLVTERDAERRDVLDLKHRGTALIVDLARLFALEAGVAATSTLARLRDAAGHGGLSHDSAEELAAAFELISLLRLRWQYTLVRRGEMPSNQVEVARLTPLERRELKEALRTVATVQRSVEFEFQTGRLA
jgi:CBS domain-containing protein